MILYDSIPSLHLAWTEFRLFFSKVSCNALQSISTLIGNPQTIPENLSRPNLRAENSNKKDLYLCSVFDVLLDAKPIGWACSTHLPVGIDVWIFCDRTTANPSMQPSVVTMKWEPSYQGTWSTGCEVIVAFKSRNTLVCSGVQCGSSLKSLIAHRYADLDMDLSSGTLRRRFLSGPSRFAYALMRDR